LHFLYHTEKTVLLSEHDLLPARFFMLWGQDFHALRARITVYFKLRTRLPVFLLSQHEKSCWK
jgi:hypothetical protein